MPRFVPPISASGTKACGHSPQRNHGAGKVDHRFEAAIGLVVPGGDATERFEFTEEILYQVTPGIHGEIAVDRAFPVRSGRYNSGCAPPVQFGPQPIGIERFVSEEGFEFDPLDQGLNANGIVPLARQKDESGQVAKCVHKGHDFRGQASPRAANGLILSPPFAPVPCWWTRRIVPSAIAYSKSGSPDKALKIFSKIPFWDQRRKRRNAEFQHPKPAGKSRQGAPVRTIHKTASTKTRLSAAVRPGSLLLPGKSGAIFRYWASLNCVRSKADLHFFSLESLFAGKVNPYSEIKCPQALVKEILSSG
jgi:hypothetical protein